MLLPSDRVRALVRVVAEIREIARSGGDPAPHAAQGLGQLVSADVCGIVAGDGRVGSNLRRMINVGITESTAREMDDHYLVRSGTGLDPAAAAILVSGTPAALRRELVSDRTWYRSEFVNVHRRRWGFDDSIYGVFRNAAGMGGIGCSRAWRSRPFDDTDRALAEIFLAETGDALLRAWSAPASPCHKIGLGRVSVDEFAADPIGRYVVGRSFAHACFSSELSVSLLLGRPNERDCRLIGQLEDVTRSRRTPHDWLLDAGRLDGGWAEAYETLIRRWGAGLSAPGAPVGRRAIVQPERRAGGGSGGDARSSFVPFPARVFASVPEALNWLGYPDAEGRLEAMARELSQEPAVIRELRTHLLATPNSTLVQASRALGLSERSLQRHLAIIGSTFRAELARARVDAARILLVETDVAVTSIALQVGCASSQNFSALFRRLTGLTPRAWRVQARSA